MKLKFEVTEKGYLTQIREDPDVPVVTADLVGTVLELYVSSGLLMKLELSLRNPRVGDTVYVDLGID